MKSCCNKIKLDVSDYVVILFSTIFFLHRSPYVSMHVPAMIYAGIVVLLFSILSISFSNHHNIIKFILPVYSLYILDFIFIDVKNASGNTDIIMLISRFMQVMIMPLLAGYILAKKNIKLALYLLIVYISIDMVTYISSIKAEEIFSGIIRLNPGQLKEDDTYLFAMKNNLNAGSFTTVYGCVALFPISVLVLKWRKELFNNFFLTIFVLFYLLLSLYFIYVSQFSFALLGVILFSCLIFFPRRITPFFFKFSLVFALFVYPLIPIVLHAIADNVESSIVAERIEGAAIIFEGEAYTDVVDVDRRKELYQKSIDTIKATSLLGCWTKRVDGKSMISGHSFILDHIALYGFVGVILLIFFYLGLLKLFYKPYKNKLWAYYYIYGLIGVSFLYLFNPDALYSQLTFCYPISAFLINNKMNAK